MPTHEQLHQNHIPSPSSQVVPPDWIFHLAKKIRPPQIGHVRQTPPPRLAIRGSEAAQGVVNLAGLRVKVKGDVCCCLSVSCRHPIGSVSVHMATLGNRCAFRLEVHHCCDSK